MKRNVCRAAIFLLLAAAMCLTHVHAAADFQELEDVTLDPNALYNGIVLPEDYTSGVDPLYGHPVTAPYLLAREEGGYHPDVVNIDVGRQLFVDDFLIDATDLRRTYHQATTYSQPVFSRRDTGVGNGTPGTSGGVWYDMEEQVYKLWYSAGYGKGIAYATSTDGVTWTPTAVNSSGSNLIKVNQDRIDSYSVWIDYDAPASQRYKMMIRSFNSDVNGDGRVEGELPGVLHTSADGLTWVRRGETGLMGDRSTFFQNWFTKDWVFSIRFKTYSGWGDDTSARRLRFYHADQSWTEAAQWKWDGEDEPGRLGRDWGWASDEAPDFWLKTDRADGVDFSQQGDIPQLYNFDSIAYESIMLGMFEIWYGPENSVISETQLPKITELQACYSRDGFHYDRPVRGVGNAFIPASRTVGEWDYGYVQSMTGGLVVYDDEIRFFYTAFSGEYEEDGQKIPGSYNGGSIGMASLRRDGFASMDGTGELTTVPLTVTKPVRYLFVNADTSGGSLRAEILDRNGQVVPGYSAADCEAMCTDSCCYRLSWSCGEDLSFLRGKGFRLRFVMEEGEFYSFWLSADPEGASGGAVGAGYAGTKNLNPVLDGEDPNADPPATEPPADASDPKGCKSAAGMSALLLLPAAACLTARKRKRRS